MLLAGHPARSSSMHLIKKLMKKILIFLKVYHKDQ
jgi:hypothetical protein